MTRLLADPPSRSGGILTKRELEAALRVLAALRRPAPASVVMSWDNDMQDMLGNLQRARYVESRPAYGGHGPRKTTAPFRSDMLATTELGSEYLDSIKKSSGSAHATRRGLASTRAAHARKTSKKYPYIAYWVHTRGRGGRESEAVYVFGTTTREDEGIVGHDLRVRPLRLGKGSYTMVVSPDDVEDKP